MDVPALLGLLVLFGKVSRSWNCANSQSVFQKDNTFIEPSIYGSFKYAMIKKTSLKMQVQRKCRNSHGQPFNEAFKVNHRELDEAQNSSQNIRKVWSFRMFWLSSLSTIECFSAAKLTLRPTILCPRTSSSWLNVASSGKAETFECA